MMGVRDPRGPIAGLVLAALLLTSCGQTYTVECGPIGHLACAQYAKRIIAVVRDNFPNRTVSRITFLDTQYDADVLLDDGTHVPFGHRLALASN
jgi:hypothetical protein